MSRHLGDPTRPVVFSGYPAPHDAYELPLLVLGIRQDTDPPWQVVFAGDRVWHDLMWQGGGMDCSRHPRFTCTVLTPTTEFAGSMAAIADKWLDSSLGSPLGGRLDQVLAYREDLRSLGLDCNDTYLEVAEAVYTIDLSPGVLARVCQDDLPDDPNELVVAAGVAGRGAWLGEQHLPYLFRDSWRLVILAENAD